MKNFSRRESLLSLGALGGLMALQSDARAQSTPGESSPGSQPSRIVLPTRDPLFNVKTLGRLQGDLSGKTSYAYTHGRVFGLAPGNGPSLAEYGRLLYFVEGVSVRSSTLREDGAIVERNRNWLFYKDPESGSYLSEFDNPYTGEKLPVPTFRAGITGAVIGVRGPELAANFKLESTVFDRPMLLDWQFIGDRAWIYRQAFTRWLEKSSGSHRTEMTLDCWVCNASDIANDRLTHIPNDYSWTSQTEWQSWLNMGNRPGAMLWRTDGTLLSSIDQLPQEFVEQCEQKMPGQLTTPLQG